MTDEQIYDWVKDYSSRNPESSDLVEMLKAFKEEILCIMIKKLGDK